MSESKIKNKTLASFFPVIVFLVYTIVTFIIWGDNKESGFWIGWVFSLIATCVTTAIPYIMVKDGKEVKSIIDGVSVHTATVSYFVAQLVLGLICMILNDNVVTLQVILEIVLIACYIVFMIASFMGINTTSKIEQNQKEKVFFIKSIETDLNLAARKSSK